MFRYISEDFGGVALHPIDLLDASTGKQLAQLTDPNLETICPVNKPHPRQDIIISGSSRSLYAWKPAPQGQSASFVQHAAELAVDIAADLQQQSQTGIGCAELSDKLCSVWQKYAPSGFHAAGVSRMKGQLSDIARTVAQQLVLQFVLWQEQIFMLL